MGADAEAIHEAYSFVCLNCGYGWEQDFEIRHTVDLTGNRCVLYFTGGQRVPSPLFHAVCPACTGRKIRTLRPGRVTSTRPREA